MAEYEVEWPRDVAVLARAVAGLSPGAWFWLDGEAPEPGGRAENRPGGLRCSYLGIAAEVRQAQRGREREFLSELRADPAMWLTAFSYEFGVALLGEPAAEDEAAPAFALRAAAYVVLDHERRTAELQGADAVALARLRAALAQAHTANVEALVQLEAGPASPQTISESTRRPPAWRRGDERYLSDVEACRGAIREGEAYVLCLTDTAEAEIAPVDPLDLYLRLRAGGAAARGGILVAHDRALVSASPERFLSAQSGRVATHPIKGTRPRGATPELDDALAAELAADPKERAENLMIVDLMRNDLSRVCEVGSVAAEGFLRVESHPRVHQLVSTVSGMLRPDVDVFDVLTACFPGGSMTGAPKRRAVQLLAEIERAPRGLYSGCFGWIDARGNAELAMTIRSVELRGLRAGSSHDAAAGPEDAAASSRTVRALVGAGGGVTIDSLAAAELAEKELKARALLAVLDASARPGALGA